mmetsp:Transcript_94646/g.271476  ORF Transcript_94646/g.271476 Transcript_94646/m.271476 type:complete len:323 (+) Transcript_94646:359-1327(+)
MVTHGRGRAEADEMKHRLNLWAVNRRRFPCEPAAGGGQLVEGWLRRLRCGLGLRRDGDGLGLWRQPGADRRAQLEWSGRGSRGRLGRRCRCDCGRRSNDWQVHQPRSDRGLEDKVSVGGLLSKLLHRFAHEPGADGGPKRERRHRRCCCCRRSTWRRLDLLDLGLLADEPRADGGPELERTQRRSRWRRLLDSSLVRRKALVHFAHTSSRHEGKASRVVVREGEHGQDLTSNGLLLRLLVRREELVDARERARLEARLEVIVKGLRLQRAPRQLGLGRLLLNLDRCRWLLDEACLGSGQQLRSQHLGRVLGPIPQHRLHGLG